MVNFKNTCMTFLQMISNQISRLKMVGKFEENLGVVHNDHDNFVDARRNVNDVLLRVSLFLNPGLE